MQAKQEFARLMLESPPNICPSDYEKLPGYISNIASNAARRVASDFLPKRHKCGNRTYYEYASTQDFSAFSSNGTSPYQAAVLKELASRFLQSFTSLPEEHRRILEATFIQALPLREAAVEMRVTLAHIRRIEREALVSIRSRNRNQRERNLKTARTIRKRNPWRNQDRCISNSC